MWSGDQVKSPLLTAQSKKELKNKVGYKMNYYENIVNEQWLSGEKGQIFLTKYIYFLSKIVERLEKQSRKRGIVN